MRKVIVNSTPLIALCHVRQLDLLRRLYGEIIIPKAVYQEISVKEDSVCKREVDCAMKWIHIKEIQNEMAKSMYKTMLHDGEVEVMILAKEECADLVIIDDKNAKKHAKYLGLPVTGTLGVLIKAKQQGLIPELKPLLETMTQNNIYIKDSLIKLCLEQVGEE